MFNFITFVVTAYIHQSCVILHAVFISSIFLSKTLLPISVLSETYGLAYIKGLPCPLASCLVKQMRRFKKKCEQRSRAKSSASSQWLWWGLAASLDQQVVTPDRQPSPHGAPSSFSLRQTLLCQDYVWHHIETVSFSRTLKLCFCIQFSWNQRLSSNIYWLSDKGLWRFRDSQFLLTCFKGKVVSTQFLDSSQYFFF